MDSKAVTFLALCCLLQAAKQVAAGRGRILEVPDYDAWLNENLTDAEINKTTRKLVEDNNDETLYNDILNNPTKYTTLQNATPPKFDIILKEDVLLNEILKNPAKFNAVLNDTALNNDPAKIIELNETAMFNEILQNPNKYTEITNGTAQNNNTANYNTIMGLTWKEYFTNMYNNWLNSVESNKDAANNNSAHYNTVSSDAAHNNSTANYNTLMGFFWVDVYNNWMNRAHNNTVVNDNTANYNTILSAQKAQP